MGKKQYSSSLRAGRRADKSNSGRLVIGGGGPLRAIIAPLLAIGLVIVGAPALASADEITDDPTATASATATAATAEPSEEPAAAAPAPEPAAAEAPTPAVEETVIAAQEYAAPVVETPAATEAEVQRVEPLVAASQSPSPSPSPSSSGYEPRLKLRKSVVNDNGGTAVASDWRLQISTDGESWQTLTNDTFTDVPAGTYTLREIGGPAGYTWVDLECDSYRSSASPENPVLTLAEGDAITCTFTNDDQPSRLHLTKSVLNDDGGAAVPSDFTLQARMGDGDWGVVPQGEWIELIPGTFELGETGGPAGYRWTGLVCDDADSTTSVENPFLVLELGQDVSCTYTNNDSKTWIDLGIVKTHSEIPATGVEAGDAFSWYLEVTNLGTDTAFAATVSDTIPSGLTVSSVTVPAGWTQTVVGNDVSVQIPELAAGGTGVIEVLVTVDALPPTGAAPFVPPGAAAPVLPQLPGDFVNTACVELEGDSDPTNDCDVDTVTHKAIVAAVWVSCINDAPFLRYDVATTPGLAAMPITMTWAPLTGSGVVPADVTLTLQSGDSGRVDWPGVKWSDAGVSYDWPGWRPLVASDYGTDGLPLPGLVVYGSSVADASEPDQAWREQTSVTFSVNPSLSYTAVYPQATPQCAVPPRTGGIELALTGGNAPTAGLLALAALSLFGGAALFATARRRRAV